jgi:hypothetical protein
VAKRMNKNQQMRWNRYTVQPFLTVRVHVLEAAPWKMPSGPCTRPSGRRNARRSPPERTTTFYAPGSRPCVAPSHQGRAGSGQALPTLSSSLRFFLVSVASLAPRRRKIATLPQISHHTFQPG